MGRFAQCDRKGVGIIVFQARGRGKEPFLFMETSSRREIFID
jgi:hypothetical protein